MTFVKYLYIFQIVNQNTEMISVEGYSRWCMCNLVCVSTYNNFL